MSKRTTRVVSTLVVALLAVAAWWLQQHEDDGSGRAHEEASSSAPVNRSTQDGQDEQDGPDGQDGPHGLPWVELDTLPPEAARTVERIDAGGPFPYPGKDGSTFGNFEGLLPDRPRGYYAEYTVPTPGEGDRGARRIIAGDQGELYWTGDHYESFERIRR